MKCQIKFSIANFVRQKAQNLPLFGNLWPYKFLSQFLTQKVPLLRYYSLNNLEYRISVRPSYFFSHEVNTNLDIGKKVTLFYRRGLIFALGSSFS